MRSLNECLGDGRSIPIPYDKDTIISSNGETRLLDLTKDELNKFKSERHMDAANECAKRVKERIDGKKCMGTSIHAFMPQEDHRSFYIDEAFVTKCLNASSPVSLGTCAGSAYFTYVQDFYKDHYYLYDNGCEGIRSGCSEKDSAHICHFHKQTENTSLLNGGWKGVPLKRLPPPVPDYGQESFHYCTLNQVLEGDITEKFGLEKDRVRDACLRNKDDFCPRKQLENLQDRCGEPILDLCEKTQEDGSISVTVVDRNDTLRKYQDETDSFVEQFVGESLRNVTESELKRRYDMKVKATISRQSAAKARTIEKAKAYNDIDWESSIYSKSLEKLYVSQLHLYMIEKMGLSKTQCERKGYTKSDKIADITKHYYSTSASYTKPTIKFPVKPSVRTVKPSVPTVKPSVHSVKPSVPTVKPSVHSVQPSIPIVKPSVPTVKPSVPTVKPSVPTAMPSVATVKPSVPTAMPSVATVRTTVSTISSSAPTTKAKPSCAFIKCTDSAVKLSAPATVINISLIPQVCSQVPSTCPASQLNVPPWGGAVFSTNTAVKTLINTCPIDNYLTIFYVIMTEHGGFYRHLQSSFELYAVQLVKIKNLFDKRMYSEGKLTWITSLFPGRFDMTRPVLDLWGNEEELSISCLGPSKTSYNTFCSSQACPSPTKTFVSHSISLRYKILSMPFT